MLAIAKWLNSAKQRLKFAKFKLQIIKFFTKFSLQLDKIWFKTPTQTLNICKLARKSICLDYFQHNVYTSDVKVLNPSKQKSKFTKFKPRLNSSCKI